MPLSDVGAFQSSGRDKIMGAITLVAILVIVYISIFGAQFIGIGVKPDYYYAYLQESYGITSGGEISLSGVRIGSVQAVKLEGDGQVLISLQMNSKYRSFYRVGSRLRIDSQLALGNVISGSGLIFVPGPEKGHQLEKGAILPVDKPQSMDDLMEEWNVRELINTVQVIVKDMSEVVSSVSQNQHQLVEMLSQSSEMTVNLAQATKQLPQIMADMNELVLTVNELGKDAGRISSQVSDVMQNTDQLTESLYDLSRSLEPTVARSPILMDNLIQVSRETDLLLNKLNQHWLLGGSDVSSAPEYSIDLPADDALYK
ncbi:MAG: MlaD family protein [Halioglobus sp.]